LSILTDWKFWSFLTALIALILSQLPPIISWFKKAKLELETYSRVHMTHKVGNPNLQAHLIIRNTGGRKVRVKSIIAEIERDSISIGILPAQSYVPDPTQTQNVIFTSFPLSPEEEWSYTVNFLNYFTRDQEKEYRSFEKSIKTNLLEQRRASVDKEKSFEAPEELVEPVRRFFGQMYVWLPGDYKVKILVKTEQNNVEVEKVYRFTLFESQSDEMKSYLDEVNTGAGLFWDIPEHNGLVIQLAEVNG
jgi:hypothetical protein